MKKFFVLTLVICSIFLITNAAMAANRIDLKVTSEAVVSKATCDKSGAFSLQFDAGTILRDGDTIKIDLPYPTVTLCRDISLILGYGSATNLYPEVAALPNDPVQKYYTRFWKGDTLINANLKPDANISDDQRNSIYYIQSATNAQGITKTGNGVYFLIQGSQKTQRVTVTVKGASQNGANDSLNIGNSLGDALVIKFFDQKTNSSMQIFGLYNANGTAATMADNTMCINVSDSAFTANTVNVSMSSTDGKLGGDKFTFIPSNPEVAHIIPPLSFNLASCSPAKTSLKVGSVTIPAGTQCVATPFDFDDNYGYCKQGNVTTHSAENRLIIQNASGYSNGDAYQVKLEIFVNNSTPADDAFPTDGGVYWGMDNKDVNNRTYLSMASSDAITNCPTAAGRNALIAQYMNPSKALVGATDTTSGTFPCTGASKAVYLETTSGGVQAVTTNLHKYLIVNIPAMVYDTAVTKANDIVYVRVTLVKTPCTSLFRGTFKVATMGCTAVATALNNTIFFPYFTATASWWNGIAIDNISDTDGTVVLTVYEQNGNVSSNIATPIAIKSRQMYVGLLSSLASSLKLTKGTGNVLTSPCYITATATNMTISGFGMMADTTTSNSMGYLTKNPDGTSYP